MELSGYHVQEVATDELLSPGLSDRIPLQAHRCRYAFSHYHSDVEAITSFDDGFILSKFQD